MKFLANWQQQQQQQPGEIARDLPVESIIATMITHLISIIEEEEENIENITTQDSNCCCCCCFET